MTNTEMVDKIVQKSGVTREQAEDALIKNNWDLLDAMIYVEKNYSTQNNTASSQYSTYTKNEQDYQSGNNSFNIEGEKDKVSNFLERVCRCLFHDQLVISHNGKDIIPIPIIVFIIILLSSISSILVIMLISMFFNVKYYFRGQELGNEKVNGIMDQIYDFVQKIKADVKNSVK